ncbi:MAG TPA: class I SAM-dependent DNA methyltransferase [Gemmata sp.]
MPRISQQELESYLWGAATLLRGTIDAGDYKQYIFPLLFLKRLSDVFDEELAKAQEQFGADSGEFVDFAENHRFQIPDGAHWRDVRAHTAGIGPALQAAMRTIEVANPKLLYGIFGDGQWKNKQRLPDSLLTDLMEHFSGKVLSLENMPEDEFGQGYEYLIKRFADDSGHTAQEFYTNRTVVHLMTELMQPRSGETVYDPTCGTGGMLLSCVFALKAKGEEYRSLKLFGQELNLMTSSIARMNLVLHGIDDFEIARGDTLAEPKFLEGDSVRKFDLVLANPPYSIKKWPREKWQSDPFARNTLGTPPQGRADYAFLQHILASLRPGTGRCTILFPHGVLFRDEEAAMRAKLVDSDVVECVLGLGPNLFYGSPMEACILVCRTKKPKERKGRVLFINAVNEVARERAQSFLRESHLARIVEAYRAFEARDGFAAVATLDAIRANECSLNIPLYVAPAADTASAGSLDDAVRDWRSGSKQLRSAMAELVTMLEGHKGEPA